jgi:hypothetical protein
MVTAQDALQLLLVAFTFAGAISGIAALVYFAFRALHRLTIGSRDTTLPPRPAGLPERFEPFDFTFLDFTE